MCHPHTAKISPYKETDHCKGEDAAYNGHRFVATILNLWSDLAAPIMRHSWQCVPCDAVWGTQHHLSSVLAKVHNLKLIRLSDLTASLQDIQITEEQVKTPPWGNNQIYPECGTVPFKKKKNSLGVPDVAQWKQIWLVSMRMWVPSLVLLSGLGIRWCCELWCRSQMQLGSHIAVAVVQASSYGSNLTPHLETSICSRCGPKEGKTNKQNQPSPFKRSKYGEIKAVGLF